MEKGVLEMYRRSMELHNIFYDPFIGEGDSYAYQCGEGSDVWAMENSAKRGKECINHVAKRKDSGLRLIIFI